MVLVEEVLSLWRDLERVRDELPKEAPERQLVDQHIIEIQALFTLVTADASQSSRAVEVSPDAIARAHATLSRAHARLESPAGLTCPADAAT